jgi:hypothetical protein
MPRPASHPELVEGSMARPETGRGRAEARPRVLNLTIILNYLKSQPKLKFDRLIKIENVLASPQKKTTMGNCRWLKDSSGVA